MPAVVALILGAGGLCDWRPARTGRGMEKQGGAKMRAIEQRLAKLEQAVSPRETAHVWQGEESLADVLAREFPDGVPNGVTVKTYCWADDRWADADQ